MTFPDFPLFPQIPWLSPDHFSPFLLSPKFRYFLVLATMVYNDSVFWLIHSFLVAWIQVLNYVSNTLRLDLIPFVRTFDGKYFTLVLSRPSKQMSLAYVAQEQRDYNIPFVELSPPVYI